MVCCSAATLQICMEAQSDPMASDIQVYGTNWCSVTFGVREYLMRVRMTYEYHDIDRDPVAERFVLAANEGRRRFPVIVVRDQIVTHPTVAALRRLLEQEDILPPLAARTTEAAGVTRRKA